jgi:uncharacterized protein
VTTVEVPTSQGPAQAELTLPGGPGAPSFLLALTHGAGGTVAAPDLRAARDAALRLGGAVALITQPYRVRGARAPGSAARQDEAWQEIIASLRDGAWLVRGRGIPLIVGGRSNGARVACRTAVAVAATGVIALAFPLRPPRPRRPPRRGESAGTSPVATRDEELRSAASHGVRVLVVNGDRDPFGIPGPGDAIRVIVLKGESHALSRNPAAVANAITGWLSDVVPPVH